MEVSLRAYIAANLSTLATLEKVKPDPNSPAFKTFGLKLLERWMAMTSLTGAARPSFSLSKSGMDNVIVKSAYEAAYVPCCCTASSSRV